MCKWHISRHNKQTFTRNSECSEMSVFDDFGMLQTRILLSKSRLLFYEIFREAPSASQLGIWSHIPFKNIVLASLDLMTSQPQNPTRIPAETKPLSTEIQRSRYRSGRKNTPTEVGNPTWAAPRRWNARSVLSVGLCYQVPQNAFNSSQFIFQHF